MKNAQNKLVYSTRSGDLRKTASRPTLATSKPAAQQNLKIMRDKKGRKGKVVTVISGFALTEKDLKQLTKTLKGLCGAGGAVKIESDGSQIVEIQGDHRTKIAERLQSLDYKVKFAGG